MATKLIDLARSALTVVNAAFGVTIFTMLYHTKPRLSTPRTNRESAMLPTVILLSKKDRTPSETSCAPNRGRFCAGFFCGRDCADACRFCEGEPSNEGRKNGWLPVALSTVAPAVVLVASRAGFLRMPSRKLTPQLNRIEMGFQVFKQTFWVAFGPLCLNVAFFMIALVASPIETFGPEVKTTFFARNGSPAAATADFR